MLSINLKKTKLSTYVPQTLLFQHVRLFTIEYCSILRSSVNFEFSKKKVRKVWALLSSTVGWFGLHCSFGMLSFSSKYLFNLK